MARAPNPKMVKAKKLYEKGLKLSEIAEKKGLKLSEIAEKLGVPDGTVRRWKCNYDWDNKRSDNKGERSEKKSERSKKNIKLKNTVVDELARDDDLTDKQKLFCIYYVKCFNATKAYQKAYKCKYETAAVNGNRLLRNTKIKSEILTLKENKLNRAFISKDDIFQKYLDIAFSDMSDYADFGVKEIEVDGDKGEKVKVKVPYVNIKNSDEVDGTLDIAFSDMSDYADFGVKEIEVDGDKGEKVKVKVPYVNIKNSDEVDGTLISEISVKKVKLLDRMRALEWLSTHIGIATKEQKAKYDKLIAEMSI